MKQYKVLTQRDKFFGGKFSPERLERALNAWATEGWELKAVATADIPGIGSRQEMVMILERDTR